MDARTATLARGLGLFSIGLGVAQIVAPHQFAKLVGRRGPGGRPAAIRLVGLRELMVGGGLLSSRPRPWLWARVGGDLVDLVMLRRSGSPLLRRDQARTVERGAMALTAVDVMAAVAARNGTEAGSRAEPREVRRSITIGRSPSEVYAFWRDLDQLPRFMRHLEQVTRIDERRSHWVATAPAGRKVEWDAEITAEEPGRSLSWKTLPGSGVEHEGTIRFEPAPGDRGTEVHVELRYHPPAGALGVAVASLLGEEPGQQVAEDLRRLKQLMETGMVVRSEATLGERRLRQHPAQPRTEAPPPITVRSATDGVPSGTAGTTATPASQAMGAPA